MALSLNNNNTAMFSLCFIILNSHMFLLRIYFTLLSLSIVLLHVCAWLVGPAVSRSVYRLLLLLLLLYSSPQYFSALTPFAYNYRSSRSRYEYHHLIVISNIHHNDNDADFFLLYACFAIWVWHREWPGEPPSHGSLKNVVGWVQLASPIITSAKKVM